MIPDNYLQNNPSRNELLARVAWLYYEEDLTQAEIGERLGITRITVNRMLKEARESGIVEIIIHSSLASVLPLVDKLRSRYGLRDAFIVQPATEGEDLYQALAREAAGVLGRSLESGITVGIGLGRTLTFLPDYFRPPQPVTCRFISLTGGVSNTPPPSTHNFDILNRLAALSGGQSVYIPAPSLVSDCATRDSIVNEPAIHQALEIARACCVAIFSIGEADVSGLLYQSGLLSMSDLTRLHEYGAVGDVLGHFYDDEGREMDIDFNRRIIGLSIAELKQIPLKILVAGGTAKRQALQTALICHFCDFLITDAASAAWLLE